MAEEFKRQTAYKCSIADLERGVFVKRPGWESSYVMTDYGDFSRVNIIAVVVLKDESSITLDDGTAQIVARVFDKKEIIEDINIGDPILAIARPREYNSQIYLTLDIIRKISDMGWIAYRKKELSLIKKIRTVSEADRTKEAQVVESPNTMSAKERIFKLVSELDKGDGADIDDIIRMAKAGNAEDIIQEFILRGEIFEIKPGKLKRM